MIRYLAARFAAAVLLHDRRKLWRGKPAPVRAWAVRLFVWGAR
jgi:hypothetical protein